MLVDKSEGLKVPHYRLIAVISRTWSTCANISGFFDGRRKKFLISDFHAFPKIDVLKLSYLFRNFFYGYVYAHTVGYRTNMWFHPPRSKLHLKVCLNDSVFYFIAFFALNTLQTITDFFLSLLTEHVAKQHITTKRGNAAINCRWRRFFSTDFTFLPERERSNRRFYCHPLRVQIRFMI